jgi:tRNA (guanine26-N2/guanine27-N2)-dimethyltransferase
MLMYQHKEPSARFDVIDLDPYGTASPFLDSAVQAVADGGLLCVTCTDMPVLSGNYSETCFAKYGSMPLKTKYVHEMSLRILLHAIDSAANKYSRHIVPWISLSVDFYIRVFVRVFESPVEVKKSCLRRVMVHQSTQCPSFHLQPLGFLKSGKQGGDNFSASHVVVPSVCEETGGRMRMGGPFWGGPLHDQAVVDRILERVETGVLGSVELPFEVPTATRIKGVLTCISEELKDAPFYYHLPDLASCLHSKVPPMLEFYSAILNAGYRCSQFHHEPLAVKTDAPNYVIWDIMRAYCKLNPPQRSALKTVSPTALAILAKESKTVVDFTLHDSLKGPRKKAARFAPNPEDNWGPKRRAGRALKEGIDPKGKGAGQEVEEKEIDSVEPIPDNSNKDSHSNSNSDNNNIEINSEEQKEPSEAMDRKKPRTEG